MLRVVDFEGLLQVGWKGYIDDKAGDGVENNCFHEQSQGVHNLEVDQNPSLPLRQSNTEIDWSPPPTPFGPT